MGLGKREGAWETEVGLGKFEAGLGKRAGAGKESWGWERELWLGKRAGAGKEGQGTVLLTSACSTCQREKV